MLTAIPLPMLETGNHLSYGLQWIAFGIMAPAGLLYFIFAEARERRRFREEQEELGTTPAVDEAAAAPPRERYGQSRRNPWQRAYDRQEER